MIEINMSDIEKKCSKVAKVFSDLDKEDKDAIQNRFNELMGKDKEELTINDKK